MTATHNPPGLFVTGTDTGVGKTYVSALISMSLAQAGYKVGVYKPAASGCGEIGDCKLQIADWKSQDLNLQSPSDDALALWIAAGRPGELERVCPQRFAAPLAPHLAARAEGKQVDEELLRTGLEYWRERSEIVIVEGAGGLMSPISDDDYVADLAFEFGYPLVVVAPNRIGVINQTLQTLIVADCFRDGIPIAGVVLNELAGEPTDLSYATNFVELSRRCVPPVLCRIPWKGHASQPEQDWMKLARGV